MKLISDLAAHASHDSSALDSVRRAAVPSIFLAVVFLLPGAVDVAGPYLDSAVFSEVARELRTGAVPYVDVWDHKPPGIFIVDALAQTVLPFGSPWIASWMASVVCTCAVLLLLGTVLVTDRPANRVHLSLLAAGVALTVYPIAVGGGLAEVPALALALGAVACVRRPRVGFGSVAVAGGVAGLACIINPQAISAALAALYLAIDGRSRPSALGALTCFATGGAIVGGATVVWLWGIGALPAAIDSVVTYNGAYLRINRENLDFRLVSPLVLSLGCLLCLLIPAAIARFSMGWSSIASTRLEVAAWIWLAAFLVLTAAQGRIAPHYFLLAVPPLTILGAPLFDRASREHGLGRGSPARVAVILGLIGTLAIGSIVTARYFTRFPNRDQVNTVGGWIKANTNRDATIFVWGNQPYLFEAADRRPAGRYIYMFPLTTPGYSNQQMVLDLVHRLEVEPPDAIVDAGSSAPGEPGWLPLLLSRPVLSLDGRELDMLDPIRDFVQRRYRLGSVVDGWPIYVLR